MATYEIETPDGATYEIEAADETQLNAAVAQLMASQKPSAAPSQPQSTLKGGMWNIPGAFMDPAAQLATSAFAVPASGLAGLGTIGTNAVGLTDADPAAVIDWVQSKLTAKPQTQAGQAVSNTIAYPFEKLTQGADAAGDVANTAVPGGNLRGHLASGGVMSKDYAGSPAAATAVNVGVQSLPAVVARSFGVGRSPRVDSGMDAGAGKPAPANPNAQRPTGLGRVPEVTPSLETLTKLSDEAYKRADEAGIVVRESSLEGLKGRVLSLAKKEGIDKDLHPDSTAALNKIVNSKGELTLTELETLRKVSSDAKGSLKPADRRIADQITDELDEYIDNLGDADVVAGDAAKSKALKEARGLYSRKKKAEEIARLIERAELSAPNFSASGMENALRTEFRALAKNDKRMRKFNAEEREAIKRVAKGGNVENALRMMGKMAPTGAVSGMFGVISSAALPGGFALPIAGLAGRYAATRMTKKNALAAEELMRRGPTLLQPDPQLSGLLYPTGIGQ